MRPEWRYPLVLLTIIVALVLLLWLLWWLAVPQHFVARGPHQTSIAK